MSKIFISNLFSVLFFVYTSYSQTNDLFFKQNFSDTSSISRTSYLNLNDIQRNSQVGDQISFLVWANRSTIYDIQQIHPSKKKTILFIVPMGILLMLTYARTSFSKDIEELLRSIINQNIAQQIFRTQSHRISLSSLLLNVNFIVSISLYAQFILDRYFQIQSGENFIVILMLIFLFTFFYLMKILALKIIGITFEVNEECDEYIYNFTMVCKTIGLALTPGVFIFDTVSEKIFNPVFIINGFILIVLSFIFIWRGLSTGYKLLYRSVYHFFVYVCVVEISPIFLLFKLLTKTIH